MTNRGETTGLPVDKGWAWIVLLALISGAASIRIVFDGVLRSSGLFIVQYQERFASSASKTTLILTFFMIFNSVAGVFVMTVGMKYMSMRSIVCVGGLMTSACYAISAFSKHIEVLIVLIGAVTGVGASMSVLTMLGAIGMYFDKRRGLANGVLASGGSIGALAFGPFYAMLFDYYGYSGTMLLASGILLNMVAVGCLIRPRQFYTRSKAKPLRGNCDQQQSTLGQVTTRIMATEDKQSIQSNKVDGESERLQKESIENVTQTRYIRQSTYVPEAMENRTVQVPLIPSNNTTANAISDISDIDRVPLSSSGNIISLSVPHEHISNNEQYDITIDTNNDTKSIDESTNILNTIFDLGILKSPVFIHYTLFLMIAVSPCFSSPLFVVPFANDIGISNTRIGILMFILGGMDLIGRLYVGILLDKKLLRSTTYMAIVFLIMAFMNNLLRLVNNFETLIVFAVIQGCLSGQFFAVYPLILIEHIGPSKFQSALGFGNLFEGIAGGIFASIIGLLRDVTGAYYWTYHLLGGLLIVAAILAFTLPYTHERHQRSNTDKS